MASAPAGGSTSLEARVGALAAKIAERLERILDAVDQTPPVLPPVTGDWRREALCAGTFNPGIKDFDEPIQTHNRNVEDLKRLCRRCPAQQQCALYAATHRLPAGVWGGIDRNPKRGGGGPGG